VAFQGSNLHKNTKRQAEITKKLHNCCKSKINTKMTRKLSFLPTDELETPTPKSCLESFANGFRLFPTGERERPGRESAGHCRFVLHYFSF